MGWTRRCNQCASPRLMRHMQHHVVIGRSINLTNFSASSSTLSPVLGYQRTGTHHPALWLKCHGTATKVGVGLVRISSVPIVACDTLSLVYFHTMVILSCRLCQDQDNHDGLSTHPWTQANDGA